MIALAETNEEALQLAYIFKVASEGLRFKQMGKVAYMRMKKGDFTNTPKNQKKT